MPAASVASAARAAPTHPVSNLMMLNKTRKACSDDYKWGHQSRYDQDEEYREQVLPAAVTSRVAIEAGVTDTWWRYVGQQGRVIGMDRFGESAPAGELFEHFGFSTDNVVAVAKETL